MAQTVSGDGDRGGRAGQREARRKAGNKAVKVCEDMK